MIVEMDTNSELVIKASSKYTLKSELEMWTVMCCIRNIINQKLMVILLRLVSGRVEL